jgi:outer membrane protein
MVSIFNGVGFMKVRVSESVAALLLSLASYTALDAQSVAYIDSQVIMAEAPGAQEAQAEFDRVRLNLQAEAERLGKEIEQLYTTYQQQESLLNASVRANRQEEIRTREASYQTRLEEMDTQLNNTRNTLLQPIIAEMTRVIEEIRAAGGHSIIFDAAGQSIVAADPALDITDVVLVRLRLESGSGAATPPAPTSTPASTP